MSQIFESEEVFHLYGRPLNKQYKPRIPFSDVNFRSDYGWIDLGKTPGKVELPSNFEVGVSKEWQSTPNITDLLKIKNLTHLDLRKAYFLNDDDLTKLGNIKTLQVLDLKECNQITEDGIGYLSSLVNLSELNLFMCKQISGKVTKHFSGLSKLRHLSVSLSDEGLRNIRNLTNLEILAFDTSYKTESISDEGLGYLRFLGNLQKLYGIPIGNVTDEGLLNFRFLRKLNHLSLVNCKHITDESLSQFQFLEDLQVLILERASQITDNGIRNLPNLYELGLQWCPNITDDGLLNLVVPRKKVEKLFFQIGSSSREKSKITRAGIEKIEKMGIDVYFPGRKQFFDF